MLGNQIGKKLITYVPDYDGAAKRTVWTVLRMQGLSGVPAHRENIISFPEYFREILFFESNSSKCNTF